MKDYTQLDLFELSDAGIRTAKQAESAEGESVEAWLDHAEVIYEGRRRHKADRAFGEWWKGLDVSYGSNWRAVLIKIGRRIADEGRPVYSESKPEGRFNLKDWADGDPEDDDELGDEWYTPQWMFAALGLRFDLDVCAPVDRTNAAVPADRFFTLEDDGLAQPWDGLVWCNPPYSDPEPWARRMIAHGAGVLLSHVPINGLWCLDVWHTCTKLRLLQGMEFVRPSGTVQRPGYWLQLAAFGDDAADALVRMSVDDSVRDRFRPSPPLAAVPT